MPVTLLCRTRLCPVYARSITHLHNRSLGGCQKMNDTDEMLTSFAGRQLIGLQQKGRGRERPRHVLLLYCTCEW